MTAKAKFINPDNSRELQRKGTLAKHAKKAALSIIVNEVGEADKFRIERLARVRAQLVRLDLQLSEESDPARLDRLMSALNRLQEAEGWLAGRAKPGNLKPAAPKPAARGSFTAPRPADDDGAQ
jgi:hypothetical protein